MPFITSKRLGVLALSAVLLIAIACGDSESTDGDNAQSPAAGGILPVIVSSENVVGPNRFMIGLLDQAKNKEVLDADVHFRFFKLQGDSATLKAETDATPIRLTKSYTHTHVDGTVETHTAGETGVYLANVDFDAPGEWGVEVSGTTGDQAFDPKRVGFQVQAESATPSVGEVAPRTVQPILKDVPNIADLDTSDPANPEMHNMTVADAVSSGKPTVIIFATPAFCTSRICGPTKEVVDDLFEEYQGRANFIHIEPYDIEKARAGQGLEPIPAVNEWGLQSEPWVFVVDSLGKIAAKYEAVVTPEELESQLAQLVQKQPAS